MTRPGFLPCVAHMPYVSVMPTTPDLITAAEVARIYGCHVRTVHRLVERGDLEPAMKAPGLRGALFFRRNDVLRLAAERAA